MTKKEQEQLRTIRKELDKLAEVYAKKGCYTLASEYSMKSDILLSLSVDMQLHKSFSNTLKFLQSLYEDAEK